MRTVSSFSIIFAIVSAVQANPLRGVYDKSAPGKYHVPGTIARRDTAPSASFANVTLDTNITLTIGEVAELIGDVLTESDGSSHKVPGNATVTREQFDETLAQGAIPHYSTFNQTAADLWMRFWISNTGGLPAQCPSPFNTNDTAGWVKMTYGIPFQLPSYAKNDTNITAWQMSRPLYSNETLYHAGWGMGFLASEFGSQCGTNYPTKVFNVVKGLLANCTDLYVPSSANTRCINVVQTS